MKTPTQTIEVRTQQELDRALEGDMVPVCTGSESFEISGNAHIFAEDHASIIAHGQCVISADGYAQVAAYDQCQVTARGQVEVTAHNDCYVNIDASAYLRDSAAVKQTGGWAMVYGNCHVVAKGYSSVIALGHTFVSAHDHANVQAWNNSAAHGYDDSVIKTWESAAAHGYGDCRIVQRGWGDVIDQSARIYLAQKAPVNA